ncbi:YcaO-like family protein [Paenibacillus tepidiphilus]|uniref:YcaO-like family protein n=1 Tax=Paenibacillus tepidiphilus TaxID=2608683 RepID=UPI00123B36D8|nr:YcaO-like family protein [Paenibacillus tepidiphilus]
MLNNLTNGTPFFIKSIYTKQNIFLNDYYQTDIIPFKENGPQSSSVSFIKTNTLKAAIGEQLERSSLYINNKRMLDQHISGVNMATSEKTLVPLYRILLNWSVPVLKNMNLNGLFNDTCGAACHVTSSSSINTAFLECFERQCLLYSWFTKANAIKLNTTSLIKDFTINRILEMASFHISELHLFDISLCEEVKVILSIGIGKDTKGVGLCANWSYKDAIIGSLSELFQYITINQNNDNIKHMLKGDNDDSLNPLLYGHHFLNVSPSALKSDFQYLYNCPLINVDLTIESMSPSSLSDKVNIISNKTGLDFVLCYIPPINKYFSTKTVKVLSPRGFPHMYAAKINPNEIEFLKTHRNEFHNIGRMIPFG